MGVRALVEGGRGGGRCVRVFEYLCELGGGGVM